jgi:penicillin-binding protein 2
MLFKIKKYFRRKRFSSAPIDPDEIFLDAGNLPQFNTQQFEGVLEKPISKRTIIGIAIAFLVVGLVYAYRVGNLQIAQGATFAHRSENNSLREIPVFANRGVISDRNGVELAWNTPGEKDIPTRSYIAADGFGHILGFVKSPMIDNNGYYFRDKFEGMAGSELQFDAMLSGTNGNKIIETDALGNIVEESIVARPHDGDNLTLSIDSRIQEALFKYIKSTAQDRGFLGGAGVIMDVNTGEIVALTSYPEYSPHILTQGTDSAQIAAYSKDSSNPFLDRAVGGLYTPGSIVKPFVAIGALMEGVVTPDTQILSTGSISVPNPYAPGVFSVFNDWKAHGWVNVRQALAVSSDVYFYEVGGGFQGQKGIGIANIEKYIRMFGIGSPTDIALPGEATGTIPNPAWKKEVFGEDWLLGDTYHTAIGQYGFQTTPIQMVRAVAAIANGGTLLVPEIMHSAESARTNVSVPENTLQVVREGMRQSVTAGTAAGLNVPYLAVASKTGTAEVGLTKQKLNSWATGFFPYDHPRYAFAVVMERGPHENTIGGVFVMRQLFDWMSIYAPEYFEDATS